MHLAERPVTTAVGVLLGMSEVEVTLEGYWSQPKLPVGHGESGAALEGFLLG